MYSIIIPTFNNLEYLKICLNSIKKNSKYTHEIIIFVNEGTDGTIDYLLSNNYKFIHSKSNLGLCTAVNKAAKKATSDHILYTHDDMYFCPGWDIAIKKELNEIKHKKYYLSGTMIESNSGHIQFDAGTDHLSFKEDLLLNNLNNLNHYDYQGSHWAPHIINREIWEKIGGFSEEFNPGIGSDPDLNMKLWMEGVRIFKGIGLFKVYHFGSISLRKKNNLIKNKGSKTFLKKWKITPNFFIKYYLNGGKFVEGKIISKKYEGPLNTPQKNVRFYFDLIKCKLKLMAYYF